jgi:putative NADPH-quinone reductase
MGARILLIQGHPDCHRPHLCHALAQAYVDGARAAGHDVEVVEPARMSFPLLTSPSEWWHGSPPPQLAAVQESIQHADHLVFVYPLWMGDMPALMRGFLEHVTRPGVFMDDPHRPFGAGLLGGRSARLVVSMGMPAVVYRWRYGGYGVKLMRRQILGRAGIRHVRTTLIGRAHTLSAERIDIWRDHLRRLGASAA